jgi:hypothetical protein
MSLTERKRLPRVQARDDSVSSFDETRIVLSFFPADNLEAGQAPTHRYVIEAVGRRPDGSRVRAAKRVRRSR